MMKDVILAVMAAKFPPDNAVSAPLPQSPGPHSKALFLELPPELRFMIYGYLAPAADVKGKFEVGH